MGLLCCSSCGKRELLWFWCAGFSSCGFSLQSTGSRLLGFNQYL